MGVRVQLGYVLRHPPSQTLTEGRRQAIRRFFPLVPDGSVVEKGWSPARVMGGPGRYKSMTGLSGH